MRFCEIFYFFGDVFYVIFHIFSFCSYFSFLFNFIHIFSFLNEKTIANPDHCRSNPRFGVADL